MPAVSGPNLTLLRTTRHATQLGLVVYPPPSIWTTQVNGTPAANATTIPVDAPTITRTPAANFQVLFGTTAGASDLGEARWRSYAAPNLTISANNLTLPDDTYVTVKEEIKPQAVLLDVNISDVVFEDGNVAYSDENLNYQPLARCGTHAVAYRDPTTGLATVQFYSRSTAIASGATLASCTWVWRGGTVTVGTVNTFGTVGVPNVVTWDTVGNYYCSLTVTDSNGKTHTRYFVVFIRDADKASYPAGVEVYTQIECEPIESDAESGVFSTTVRVFGSAGPTSFPKGALCVLFARDWYGSTQQSIGNETYRENIVFVGYIKSDAVQQEWWSGNVEFEVESVSGVMDAMTVIPHGLETTAGAPTAWHSLKNLTFNLAVHHILTQHTTVSQICDVYPNLPSYTEEFIDLPDGSVLSQLKDIIRSVRSQCGCNSQGHFYLEVNPQLQPSASRSTTYVLTTQNTDFRDTVDFGTESHRKETSQVIFTGETDIGDPYFSMAPALPWPTGKPETVEGIRVADQAEANELAGVFEGYYNLGHKEIPIQWRGNYRCWDVFPREPFRLTVTPADARGETWTNVRCWTNRVSISYRNGIVLVDTVVERDNTYATGTGEGEDSGVVDPYVPPVIPTPYTPVPFIPLPPIPTAYATYDVGGGYVGAFASALTQAVGLVNGSTWYKYFVTVTGAIDWTIDVNGVTVASGTGSASGSLSPAVTFAANSYVVFAIDGGGSNLYWGIGV